MGVEVSLHHRKIIAVVVIATLLSRIVLAHNERNRTIARRWLHRGARCSRRGIVFGKAQEVVDCLSDNVGYDALCVGRRPGEYDAVLPCSKVRSLLAALFDP